MITDVFVGVVRLELTTTCTPCKYASQLRHTPIFEERKSKYYFLPIRIHPLIIKDLNCFTRHRCCCCICLSPFLPDTKLDLSIEKSQAMDLGYNDKSWIWIDRKHFIRQTVICMSPFLLNYKFKSGWYNLCLTKGKHYFCTNNKTNLNYVIH